MKKQNLGLTYLEGKFVKKTIKLKYYNVRKLFIGKIIIQL